jgi:peptidoglycan lytic transglycosylase
MTARRVLVTFVLATAVARAAGTTPPTSPPPPPPRAKPPATATFTPGDAEPYFTDGPAAAAASALRLEDYAAAARGFDDYVQKNPRAADAHQAAFLAAYAELKAGREGAAARGFDALVKPYPLLADYHLAWAARAYLAAGKANDALTRAKRVPRTSALDGEARFTRAEAQRALGHAAEAADEYGGYVTAYPASWRAAEARFRRGEMLAAVGKQADASTEWRRVYLEAPFESWGRQAEQKLAAEPRTFDAPELVTRATALFDNMRNAESEAEWQKVLAAPALTDALACVARFHVAQSVFKQRDRMRAAPLFDAAAEACAKAKDDDLTAKALYQGGRSWGTKGEKDVAATKKGVERFERVWREHPAHSYADDARLREAELYDALKDEAHATELLKGIPDAFPSGDQKGEALWRLAYRALRKNDLDGARGWLELELKLLPREDGWYEAGRTLYWLGRVADRANQLERATIYWQRCAREYPLSYYALLAINRVRERDAEAGEFLVDELAADPGDVRGWEFSARPLFAEAAFRRGLELARLGLGPEAKRELGTAGLRVPVKRGEAVGDAELAWLAAVLYDRAGEFAISHFIARWVLIDWQKSYPIGEARKRWLLAYPRGYAELIVKHAVANALPPALEFAIVREESGFDPMMESFANAIGLTQLTAAPAERFAQGLPHDRAALHDPAINVTIGARELGDVFGLYGGAAPLAIAAYNAGAGAVNRWLRDPERAGLPLDEWVEAIPYDETRGYTKRVLSSFFAYTWLGEAVPRERVPVVMFALPKKIGR